MKKALCMLIMVAVVLSFATSVFAGTNPRKCPNCPEYTFNVVCRGDRYDTVSGFSHTVKTITGAYLTCNYKLQRYYSAAWCDTCDAQYSPYYYHDHVYDSHSQYPFFCPIWYTTVCNP